MPCPRPCRPPSAHAQAYYCRGSSPVAPPSLEAAEAGSPRGGHTSKASSSGGGSSSDTPYASWQVHYEVRSAGTFIFLGAVQVAAAAATCTACFIMPPSALHCRPSLKLSFCLPPQYHYAPLASDLAKYGRAALKGAAAAACRAHPPIQPFAQ